MLSRLVAQEAALQQGPAPDAEDEVAEREDPYFAMWGRAVDALDESYDQWNYRPGETVDSTTFTINYIASLATDGRRRLDRVMILHADPNRDRAVTRKEALSFLETQLGLKWVSGDTLRYPQGRVVAFADFLRADTDQNDEISESEFVVAMWDRGGTADFGQMDIDGNGVVALEEYTRLDGPNICDLNERFQRFDSDKDGRLSANELQASVPIHRRHLISSNLAGFDEDGDRALSFHEYQLSMLGNFNYPWEYRPRDENHDDALSFDEFQFHPRDLFQLQKRYYFHRLDQNHDGLLTDDEFVFEKQKFYSLHTISGPGQKPKLLYKNPKYPVLGAPSVSKDGKSVLFHAIPPEGEHQATLVLIAKDGSESREIGHGLMPSWSPRGDRFTCSRYEQGAGVWVMRSDGNPVKRIDDGWGARWSPNGRWIAYTNDNGIRLYDVDRGLTTPLLGKGSHPYRYLHPRLAWSTDGTTLAFLGNLNREVEIATASSEDDWKLVSVFRTTEELNRELAWSLSGDILFGMYSRKVGWSALYQVMPQGHSPPSIVPDFATELSIQDIAVDSHAGTYVFTAAE